MSGAIFDSMKPKKDDDPNYIVAWRYKYDFKAGRYEEVMTYGKARKRAEELSSQHPDMAFWPERLDAKPSGSPHP